MVQQHPMPYHVSEQHQFCLKPGGNDPTFCKLMQHKKSHSPAHMDTQELVSQCNMTHWTHMEVMEWFSSILCHIMCPNSISFV